MNRICVICFFFLVLSSCNKPAVDLGVVDLSISTSDHLMDAILIDSSLYIVGGVPWELGSRWSSPDLGLLFSQDSLNNKMLAGITLDENGEGAAVGQDGHVYTFQSLNGMWTFHRLAYWENLHAVFKSDEGGFHLAGGVSFGTGSLEKLDDNLVSQNHRPFTHEIRDIVEVGNKLIAVGYGLVLESDDAGENWDYTDIDGDFFTAIHFVDESTGYVVGQNGTILKSMDGGISWKKIRNGNKPGISQIAFTDVFFNSPDAGFVCGHDGVLWRTSNGGESWEELSEVPELDFQFIVVHNGIGFAGGLHGALIRFNAE